MRINTQLWEHQNTMRDYALDKFRNGVGDVDFDHPDVSYAWWYAGCGVGKTLSALAIIEPMNFQRTLVLTKKAAITSAWRGDLQKYVEDIDYVLLGDVITTPIGVHNAKNSKYKAKFMREYVEAATQQIVVVVNYETASLIVEDLRKLNFDFVIADESHKLKSYNSKQSLKLTKHLMDVPYKLIMTGTGWSDRPTDIYGQVRFLDPVLRGRGISSSRLGSWGAFFEKFVTYYQKDNIKIPKKYKNLDDMQEILNEFTLYVDNEEVLDLPPAIHMERILAMPPAMSTAYSDLERHMVAEIGDDLLIAAHRLTQAMRLHQLTGGFYPNEAGDIRELLPTSLNPKVQAVLDIMDEIDRKPTVIFTRFKQDVLLLDAALSNAGYSVKKLIGGTYEHDEWQEGNGDILIANIQAGGTGVNLTRARYCIYYSVGHSRTDYEQSLARVRRAGSDKNFPITYFHLMMEASIDTEIQEGLNSKGEMSDFLLKGIINRLTP